MNFEFVILDFIQEHMRSPVGDALMKCFSMLGEAGILWIAMAVILLICPKTRRIGGIVTAALILDVIVCNGMLKPLVARTRPYDINTAVQLIVKKPWDYSFPSGHTAAAFAATTALICTREKRLWIPALVVSVLIAFSRLYLYVHFPTDVLGGLIIGVLCGLAGNVLFLKIEKLWKKRRT
ncbi:MAG: phosphatase PAP2 family protein [Lachnospiraceae bacterium]|nr:phosphatase PAP2 family protein [Lachnospiraceae bacterium]